MAHTVWNRFQWLIGCAALAASAMSVSGAPAFSVSGFVDEEIFSGNGVITVRFDADGRMWVTEKQGRILMAEPNTSPNPGYIYEYYEKPAAAPNWSAFPDLGNTNATTFVKGGLVSTFTIEPRQTDDYFAFRFSGTLDVPTTGLYTFYLTSDDGSLLYIDGNLVVDHNGLHGNTEKSGSIVLTNGTHDLVVQYFEAGGGQALSVAYDGPSIARGPLASGPFAAPVVVANLSAQVDTDGESGMTGMALDPGFTSNRFMYVLYATPVDQRISRITINSTFTAMEPGSETILLSGLPNINAVHKAGDMAFHPSDPFNLYVMLGDDGQREKVASLTNYNGKILRINAADGMGLPVNPYYDGSVTSVASRIWSARYRNPFRFDFDPAAPVPDVLYISENGDGTDRLARIEKGADGGWDNQFLVNSGDGKRMVLQTSPPSKTAIALVRGGAFAPGGSPVLYHARYGGGDRNEVRRWAVTGAEFDTLTPIPADNSGAFYSGYENRGIVDFELGPDGALYYTDSNQGSSIGSNYRVGRIRFVGGTPPVADFTIAPEGGVSPLLVAFTDASTAPSSSVVSWQWEFGDGATSEQQHPSHTYAQPGVYTAALTVANALGLTHTAESVVRVVHPVQVSVTGAIFDGRTLPAESFATATEMRFYQIDGVTPLSFPGGLGTFSNALAVPPGGVIDATLNIELTGPGLVVSAGDPSGDGIEPVVIGVALSTVQTAQSAAVKFYVSDTMLRGRVLDTRGDPARVDLGVARGTIQTWFAFAGGRDVLPGAGVGLRGVPHRTVPDALGYYHVPIITGGGDAMFFIDTSLDTLAATHGRYTRSNVVAAATSTVINLTVGLYDGGAGEADLSTIAETPDVEFTSQIQSIFSSSCAACHNDIASNSGGLDLQSGAAFDELVGRFSVEARGVMLVEPGAPERSYLMEKINASVPQLGTSMRPGDPMALAQRALIRDWIKQLAPSGNIEFASAVYTVQESNSTVTADITVRRVGGTKGAVGVTASTVIGGTATGGDDFTSVNIPVVWSDTDGTNKQFSVIILSDSLAEGDETVVLQLLNPTGGAELGLLPGATLTIHDRPFDAWRFANMGSAANQPEGQPTEDYDGDGLANLFEYGIDTDPSIADATGGASGGVVLPAGLLQLRFTRNTGAVHIAYEVQAANAVTSHLWNGIASRQTTGAWLSDSGVIVNDNEETGEVLITDAPSAANEPTRYLRLRVSQLPD